MDKKRLLPWWGWLVLAYFVFADICDTRNIHDHHSRLTAIETQLAIDANCIATLEELQRAGERAQGEAGK